MKEAVYQVPSQRRLQRAPDFTGQQLTHFSQVALRHGLPGFLLGVFLLLPYSDLLVDASGYLVGDFSRYVLGGVTILLLALTWSWYLDRSLSMAQFGWVLYLLLVSVWEEWIFRVVLPHMAMEAGLGFTIAVLVSNACFGAVHYFTLRWKLGWCVLAFVGGIGLSRQYLNSSDLLLVIGTHWFVTFLNTPRYPGKRNVTTT